MAKIRRCPTCKVVFPTIKALNLHYESTLHFPLPYKCEYVSCEKAYDKFYALQRHIQQEHPDLPLSSYCPSCKGVFKTFSTLLNHFQSEHPHLTPPLICEPCQRLFETRSGMQAHNQSKRHLPRVRKTEVTTPASTVIAQMDVSNSRKEDGPKDVSTYGVQRLDNSILPAEKQSSVILSSDISIPPPVSEPSSSSSTGPSTSKAEEAAALARAALRNRFAELGVSNSGETTPLRLLKSNMWGLKMADLSALNLDGSCSNAANLTPNSSNLDELSLPLGNTTPPFICPGCRMDFRLFSGFVLHIENRSCKSSMCHEIEDEIGACATQLFDNLTRSWAHT